MYKTYSKKRKSKISSSFIPLLLILVIGGFVGNKIIQNANKNNNENLGNSENQITNIIQNNITDNTLGNNENQNSENLINNAVNEESNNAVNNNTVNEESNNTVNENEINEDKTDKNTIKEDDSNDTDSTTSNNKKVSFDSSVAFIGDSRTQGFIMYNGLKSVQDYSYIGLMVDTAVTKKFVKTSNGQKITLLEDMANRNIKSVYIMLGVNELGWVYPQVFKKKYEDLIDEIRKVKPNCKIYVQSIIPMTKTKSDNDKIFNNSNVAKFNKLVQEVAKEKNVTYLDVKSALVDENGNLPEEASTDGIHVDKEYCEKWLNYLKNNS